MGRSGSQVQGGFPFVGQNTQRKSTGWIAPHGQPRLLTSYGGLRKARPRVFTPRSVEAARQVLQEVATSAWRVTFQGGGRSFDDQALNDDVVIDLSRLNAIRHIDLENRLITVEAGATWWSIVHAARPYGLAPCNLVSSRTATAGGTISGNCYSAGSCIHGRQGLQVERFTLLTVGGDLLECSHAKDAAIFHAVISGQGYLGAVLDATFRLLSTPGQTQVETDVQRYLGADELIRLLQAPMPEGEDYAGMLAPGFLDGSTMKGFVFRYKNADGRRLRPLYASGAETFLLFPLIRLPFMGMLLWRLVYGFMRPPGTYVDNADSLHFYMRAHEAMRRWARRLGISLPTIRQEFVVPPQSLPAFLASLSEAARAHRIAPTLIDVAFIRQDDFLLSANFELPGYLVGMELEGLPGRARARAIEMLKALSTRCADLGGRVSLIKQVYAHPADLQRMYAATLPQFLALKKRLDPGGVLCNAFLERTFGFAARGGAPQN